MNISEVIITCSNWTVQHKAALEPFAVVATIISVPVTVFFAFVTVRLTWIMLRFTIKPKVRIKMIGTHQFISSKEYTITFELKNIGYRFYGNPPALGITAWVNVQEAFEPIQVCYGSTLENELEKIDVRRGKGNSKYFKIERINLFFEEPPEYIKLTVKMPKKEGKYLLWISLSSTQGGYTVFRRRIKVCKNKKAPDLEKINAITKWPQWYSISKENIGRQKKLEMLDTGKHGKGALDTAIASESSLGKDWLRQEEEQAWQSL